MSALGTAVDDAIKNGPPAIGEINPDGTPKEVKEVKEPKDKKDDKDNSFSDEDALQAKNLLVSLRDPEKAPIVIKFLAEQAGYTKAEVKADLKEAKKDIKAHLTEHLGDEFAPLIEKLGPALDAWAKGILDDSTKDIKEQLSESLEEKTRTEVTNVMGQLAKDNHDSDVLPDNVLDEISKLQKSYPPQPGMKNKEYIQFLYNAAVGKLGITKQSTTKNERNNKNLNDVGNRLASEGKGNEKEGVTIPKKMSLTESVNKAIEDIAASSKN